VRLDTRLVQAGQEPEPVTGDVVPAIHLSTTYERRAQQPPRYFYGRTENPTRERLEQCLAALEEAPFAATFASGQAAAATTLSLLPPDQRIVCVDDVYAGTDALLERLTQPVDYADLSDPRQRDQALSAADLGMVWVETPTNPGLKIVDIAAVRDRIAGRGVLLVVDNTFATPLLQQPLALGADISLYSTTKFIAGHGDVLGGALVYRDAELHEAIRSYRDAAGNIPGALDCYLIHRGLKTLSVRVERQVRTAQALVELLREHPAVGTVHYPGMGDHPNAEIARRQMRQPGSVISFDYLGDPAALLDRVHLFACAVSLGGVRSLIECPALMTHGRLPAETRRRRGISDSLIRLSAGLEDPDDLVADLKTALDP
jgi:cystathionine beta-lyase/cystathionine gamma-synthase